MKTFDYRKYDDDIEEKVKQTTQILVRLTDQPIFKVSIKFLLSL